MARILGCHSLCCQEGFMAQKLRHLWLNPFRAFCSISWSANPYLGSVLLRVLWVCINTTHCWVIYARLQILSLLVILSSHPEVVGPERSPTSTDLLLLLKKLENSSQPPLWWVMYQVLQARRLRGRAVSVVSPAPLVIGGMGVVALGKADNLSYPPT